MAGPSTGRKGKRVRRHKFLDPFTNTRRNLTTEINKVTKKLRHWIKRGMSEKRECYLALVACRTNLETHLVSIQKSFTSDSYIKKAF